MTSSFTTSAGILKDQDYGEVVDAIVVGAGVAGLVTSVLLQEAGLRTVLLEASDRVGGRLMSVAVPGLVEPVELGAEFIHGCPADLMELLQASDLTTYELSGSPYCWNGEQLERFAEDRDWSVMESLKHYTGPEMSFAAYLQTIDLPAAVRAESTRYVEGFNAASADDISVRALAKQQAAEEAIQGDRAFHVRAGYAALTRVLLRRFTAAGGECLLGHWVIGMRWASKRVEVDVIAAAPARNVFRARRAVLAIPLGVLKSKLIEISPWPEAYDALDQLAMGKVHRMTLVFKRRFWAEQPWAFGDLHFLFVENGLPRVWWTSSPSQSSVLTAWIGGREAEKVDAAQLLGRCKEMLCQMFNMLPSELDEVLTSNHSHDWNQDPLACGAYSYVRVGGLGASKMLSLPVDRTIFMAGEHTDVTGHWGTVHGALRSGVRAARQVLEAV